MTIPLLSKTKGVLPNHGDGKFTRPARASRCGNLNFLKRCRKPPAWARRYWPSYGLTDPLDGSSWALIELPSNRELSVSNVPLTIGGCLPAVAVAEAGTSTPSPFRMRSVVPPTAEAGTSTPSPFRLWSVVAPVAEAGTSTPSPFRLWSVVAPVAEAIVAVPLVVVPVRVTVIVPVAQIDHVDHHDARPPRARPRVLPLRRG